MNRIGLDPAVASDLADKLNDLLANYQVYYMNVRGFHWNIRGDKFFELHMKFEELYTDLLVKIDEVAERVLTLGKTPVHAYSDYVAQSQVRERKDHVSAEDTVQGVLDGFEILLAKQRVILDLSAEANEEGTNALMSDYIREQEKLVWMYSAFLAPA